MKSHVMIDIETMGNGVRAAIMSIGAVRFDPFGTEVTEDGFLVGIDLNDSIRCGGEVTASTVLWWLEQSKEAKEAYLTLMPKMRVAVALKALSLWCKNQKLAYVWSHGVSFDLMILNETYLRIGEETPWHYKGMRDTRTLFDAAERVSQKPVEWGVSKRPKHDPLGDAIRQAGAVQNAYRLLMGR